MLSNLALGGSGRRLLVGSVHGRPLGWHVARLSCSSLSTFSPAAVGTWDRRTCFASPLLSGMKKAGATKERFSHLIAPLSTGTRFSGGSGGPQPPYPTSQQPHQNEESDELNEGESVRRDVDGNIIGHSASEDTTSEWAGGDHMEMSAEEEAQQRAMTHSMTEDDKKLLGEARVPVDEAASARDRVAVLWPHLHSLGRLQVLEKLDEQTAEDARLEEHLRRDESRLSPSGIFPGDTEAHPAVEQTITTTYSVRQTTTYQESFMSEPYYAEEHFGDTEEDPRPATSAPRHMASSRSTTRSSTDFVLVDEYPEEHFGDTDEPPAAHSNPHPHKHPHRASTSDGTSSGKGGGKHSLPPGLAPFEGMLATAGYGSSSPRESGFAFGEPFWEGGSKPKISLETLGETTPEASQAILHDKYKGSAEEEEIRPVHRMAVQQSSQVKSDTAQAQSAKHEGHQGKGKGKGKEKGRGGGKQGGRTEEEGGGAKARVGVDGKATVAEAASKAVKQTTENLRDTVQSVSGGVSAAADLARDAVTGERRSMDHPENVAKLANVVGGVKSAAETVGMPGPAGTVLSAVDNAVHTAKEQQERELKDKDKGKGKGKGGGDKQSTSPKGNKNK